MKAYGTIGLMCRVCANGSLIQRLKKWYLMPPCLTLSIIGYVSRVKWSNSDIGVAPSFTPRCTQLLKMSLAGNPRVKWPTLLVPHSPKLQHYWSLTRRLSCIISRLSYRCSRWILQHPHSADWAIIIRVRFEDVKDNKKTEVAFSH